MRYLRYALLGLLALAALVLGSAAASPGATERVSVDSAGNEGNYHSYAPAISADGRFVAFKSLSTNLVPGDTNGAVDIFVHDRQTGVTERVSVDSAGNQANGASSSTVAISADGRYVAFYSVASNLVPGDTNDVGDAFLHDRQTGVTERVSVDSAGNQANGGVGGWAAAAMSADGRYVSFTSSATNLVPGDTNTCGPYFDEPGECPDVFVHDRQTGETTRVSLDSAGNEGNGRSGYQGLAISADGWYVAFESAASNLVPGDTNDVGDAFLHDRQTGVTERVNVDSAGNQGNGGSSSYPDVTAGGRYVAFVSFASNLVPGDTNGAVDIFVHDRQTGVTQRVNVDSAGNEANGASEWPLSTSADGRYVAFTSRASNLVPGDTNLCPTGELPPDDMVSCSDVFVHDLGDTDGDGEWDPFDNCPAWPNADQSLPPWPVPPDDPDCDGWSSADEAVIGTYPTDACPATGAVSHGPGYENDEDPDAWPADMNDDQVVNLSDILFLAPPVFFSVGPSPPYDVRYDLNLDNVINLSDLLYLAPPVFFSTCTP